MLDRFDGAVYLYVFVPLAELWPASGMAPVKASIALYVGYLFTVFTLGRACSMFWNWPADRTDA